MEGSVIPEYGGFVVAFEAGRSKTIWRLLDDGYGFRDSFSVDDWDLNRRDVFFLTLKKRGKEIDAAALVHRAHGDGGTGKPKYGFDNIIKIEPPVTASEIEDVVPDLKEYLSTPTRGRRFDVFIWRKLVKKIKQLRPQIAEELDALLELVDKEADLLGGTNRLDRLAEQRDALGTVLELGDVGKSEALKSIDSEKASSAKSILDLMDDLPIHERHLVENDAVILRKIFVDGYRGASFSNGAHEVRVYVADKTRLETALGTDLIIYQSLWDSIILVQYKLMSNHGTDESGWHYRPDAQFDSQVKQTELLMKGYPACVPKDPWALRLCDGPIYFKFCERRRPTSRDDSLVRGMSMGWKILSQFLKMKESLGPKDGRIVGYKNCPRYFNNTEFGTMAKMGWIGSSSEGTRYLEGKIRDLMERKREPIVAIVDTPKLSTVELRKASRSKAPAKKRRAKVR